MEPVSPRLIHGLVTAAVAQSGRVPGPARMLQAPLRILVVEDESAHAQAICRALLEARPGASIACVGSLREYESSAAAQAPDLVIVDWVLPDGRAEKILQSPPESGLFPIVVMTSHGDEHVAVAALQAGALDYVVKSPEAFAEMPHTVDRALRAWRVLMDREAALGALQESEADLAEAQRLSRMGSWRYEIDSNRVRWSTELYRIFELERTDFSGTLEAWLALVHPDDLAHVNEANARGRADGRPFELEYRIRTRIGQTKVIREVGYGVKDPAGRVVRLFGTAQDITEQKAAQAALCESEERFRSLFKSMTEVVAVHELVQDAKGKAVDYRILDCNPAFTALTGLSREQVVGALASVVYGAGEAPYLGIYVDVARTGQPRQFETFFPPLQKHFLISVFSPAPGRFATVAADITERKRAEAALQRQLELQHQVASIATAVPGMIYSLRRLPDGRLQMGFVTEAIQELCGCDPEELRENFTAIFSHMHPEDVEPMQQGLEASARTLKMWHALARLSHPRKGEVWVESYAVPQHEAGGITLWHGYAQDVTERKRAEQNLRESEQRFATTFRASPGPVAISRLSDGAILDVNAAFLELYGYRREDIIGQSSSMLGLWPGFDRSGAVEQLLREKRLHNLEVQARRKSGELRDVLASWELIEVGGEPCILGIATDITERKEAERLGRVQHDLVVALAGASRLQDGLELCVKTAIQASGLDSGGIYLLDPETRLLDLVVHEGLAPEFVREVSHYDASAPQFQLIMEGKPAYLHFTTMDLPLSEVDIREGLRFLAVIPLAREGRIIGCLNVSSHTLDDIASPRRRVLETVAAEAAQAISRLKAEEALRQSEERFRQMAERIDSVFWISDHLISRVIYVSPAYERVWGRTCESLYQHPRSFLEAVHPEDRERISVGLRSDQLGKQVPFEVEYRIIRPDGSVRWIRDRGFPVPGDGTRSPGMVGIADDITERKRAEELALTQHRLALALASSSELTEALRLSLEVALECGGGLDCGGFYLLDEATGALGLRVHQGLSSAFVQSVARYDASSPAARQVVSGKPFYFGAAADAQPLSEAQRQEGLRFVGVIPLTREGKVLGCLSVASHKADVLSPAARRALESITAEAVHAIARLKAEEALQEGRERLELALSAARMGTWDWELASGKVEWSGDHESLWGYLPGEFQGTLQEFQSRIHPEDWPGLLKAGELALREKRPFTCEYRVVWLDGSVHWVTTHGRHFLDAGGKAVRLSGVVFETTERKRAEEQLRNHGEQLRALSAHLESLRETERSRMAREVHDVLGQMLTALKMDLSWWERRFAGIKDKTLRQALEAKAVDTNRLTDQMIETVQKISRELRPSVLDNIGLGAALQFEAREFFGRTGITCEVRVPAETFSLSPDQATAMFRVYQELLTNVARHAQATRVVAVLSQQGERVTLEVSDNGRGIRAKEVIDPKSLGLLSMTERASLLGGSFRIRAEAGGGTVATLTLPVQYVQISSRHQ